MTFALALWSLSVAKADTCSAWVAEAPVFTATAPIQESSGIASSALRPGVFFTHDDRGGAASLYSYDHSGALLAEHDVRGASNIDWEGLAAGPCPDGGACLYIGDIGDNDGTRDDLAIHIVREPGDSDDTNVIRTHRVRFPDQPNDAEALLVHPCSGRIYLITKPRDGLATVWRLPRWESNRVETLELVAGLSFPATTDGETDLEVTGGEFDSEGDQVVVRTASAIWAWTVDPDQPEAHWSTAPSQLPDVDLADSEAIAFTTDGDLVVSSEGQPMPIAFLRCDESQPAQHLCDPPLEPLGCACQTSPLSPSGSVISMLLLIWFRRRSI